jgi:hypothetical protein
MHETYVKHKICLHSLFIVLMIQVLTPLLHFNNVLEVHASSSCVSQLDCSSSSDDSSASNKNKQKHNDKDSGSSNEDQKKDKNGGDIESKIPSIAGVPFP